MCNQKIIFKARKTIATNITNVSQSCSVMDRESIFIWTSIYALVGIFVIFFNSIVLLSFIKNKSLRTRTNYFIASLAWADLLVGAISVPGWLAIILTGYQGYPFLQAWTAFDMLAGIGSIFHLMALSWDRLCAIAWPLRHRLYTRRKYISILCGVWGFSIFISGLSVVGNQRDTKTYNISVVVLCFFLPLLGIIIAQGTIFYRIHQTQYRSEQRSTRHIRREIRAAKAISIMIVLFVIGWLPFFTISLVNYIKVVVIPAHAVLAVKLLQYSNSLFNPILYAQKFPEFRRAYAAMLCFCLKNKKEQYKKNLHPTCTYYRTGTYRSVIVRSPQTSRRFTSEHTQESSSKGLKKGRLWVSNTNIHADYNITDSEQEHVALQIEEIQSNNDECEKTSV